MNKIPGYITDAEERVLREIFLPYNTRGSIGVEIGSLHGRSSVEIASSVPNATLYCIDGWDGYDSSSDLFTVEEQERMSYPKKGTLCTLEFFRKNTQGCPNIVPIRGYSPQHIRNWNAAVSFVFLDALHANPSDWDNILFWMPRLKSGGRFAGHDYYPDRSQWPDVYDNVKSLEKQLQRSVINPRGTSIWYFDKP